MWTRGLDAACGGSTSNRAWFELFDSEQMQGAIDAERRSATFVCVFVSLTQAGLARVLCKCLIIGDGNGRRLLDSFPFIFQWRSDHTRQVLAGA